MKNKRKSFVGVVLPEGVDVLPKQGRERAIKLTKDETSKVKFAPGTPILNNHDETALIGEIRDTFDFPSGEKGVIGRFDAKTPSGKYFRRKEMKVGTPLSLTSRWTPDGGKRGDVLFGKTLERATYGDQMKFQSLSTVKVPERDGCEVLFLFDDAEYNGDDLKALQIGELKTMAAAEEEAKKQLADMTQEETMKKMQLIAGDRDMKLKEIEELQKKLDAQKAEFDTQRTELDVSKKTNEDNEALKKMFQDQQKSRTEQGLDEVVSIFAADDPERAKVLKDTLSQLNPYCSNELTLEERGIAFDNGVTRLVECGRIIKEQQIVYDRDMLNARAKAGDTTVEEAYDNREAKKRKANDDATPTPATPLRIMTMLSEIKP